MILNPSLIMWTLIRITGCPYFGTLWLVLLGQFGKFVYRPTKLIKSSKHKTFYHREWSLCTDNTSNRSEWYLLQCIWQIIQCTFSLVRSAEAISCPISCNGRKIGAKVCWDVIANYQWNFNMYLRICRSVKLMLKIKAKMLKLGT